MSTEEDIRNERLSQVLLHNIGVFTDAFKLSEKIPVNTGNLLFFTLFIISIQDLMSVSGYQITLSRFLS